MPPFNDYRYIPLRASSVLTTGYIAAPVIGAVPASPSPDYTSGPVGLLNQLIIYVNLTLGSLTTAELIVEFSNDQVTWVQETFDSIAATGLVSEVNMVRQFAASGNYRIPIKTNDQYYRVSIKGTGTVTGSLATLNAIVGNN